MRVSHLPDGKGWEVRQQTFFVDGPREFTRVWSMDQFTAYIDCLKRVAATQVKAAEHYAASDQGRECERAQRIAGWALTRAERLQAAADRVSAA